MCFLKSSESSWISFPVGEILIRSLSCHEEPGDFRCLFTLQLINEQKSTQLSKRAEVLNNSGSKSSVVYVCTRAQGEELSIKNSSLAVRDIQWDAPPTTVSTTGGVGWHLTVKLERTGLSLHFSCRQKASLESYRLPQKAACHPEKDVSVALAPWKSSALDESGCLN